MKNIKLPLLFLTVFALNPFAAQAGTFSKFATSARSFFTTLKNSKAASFVKKHPFLSLVATYGTLDYQNNKRQLFKAAQTGNMEIIKDVVCKRGWSPHTQVQNLAGNTPLHIAARHEQEEATKFFLRYQRPTKFSLVSDANPLSYTFGEERVFAGSEKNNPFSKYIASLFGAPARPDYTINKNYPTNMLGRTPLHEAGLSCNEKMFELVERETKHDQRKKRDIFGTTAKGYLMQCPKESEWTKYQS